MLHRRLSSESSILFLAGAVLLGLLVYELAPGLGLTTDSRFYLAAARSFGQTGELRNPDGSPYSYWGPLYPVLLAPGLGRLVAWASVLHIGSVLGTLYIWARLLRRFVPWGTVAGAGTLLLGLSVPWLATAKFVWSEPVFDLLFAAYVYALFRYLDAPPRPGWLVLASLCGLLLLLQRTSGIFLLAGVGVGLLAGFPQLLRQRGPALALHGAVSVAGLGLWRWHLHTLAVRAEYIKNGGWPGLWNALSNYGFVYYRWLLPVQQAAAVKSGLFAVGLIILLLAVLLVAWPRGGQLRLLAVVLVVYTLCHVLTTTLNRADNSVYDIERYLAVLYGPFVLLLCVAGQQLARRWPVAAVVFACWLIYPAVRAGAVAHFNRHLQPELPATAAD